MNRTEAMRINEQADRLSKLGFTWAEAEKLRLISKTLSRWAERECNGEIERDCNSPYKPYRVWDSMTSQRSWERRQAIIPDKESCALRRLQAILSAHPGLDYYHQTDPRGAALYIYRHADVIPGVSVESSYSTIGLAVY